MCWVASHRYTQVQKKSIQKGRKDADESLLRRYPRTARRERTEMRELRDLPSNARE